MKALQCLAYGIPAQLAVATLPDPTPGPDEVLVKVESVGIGYFDAVLVGGKYQEKPALPFIPGREFSGRIVGVGASVSPNLVGRRISAISFTGSMAELALAKADDCLFLPDNFPDDADGSFISAYATALYALETCGQMKPGERVLVLGAAGTVGVAAIDIAKALGGVVVAAASSAEKRDYCQSRGADFTIDYTDPDWRKVMAAEVPGSIDLVVDPVGGSLSETAFRCLNPGGRFLVVGFASGEIGRLPLNLPLLKRANVVGVDWGGFMQKERPRSRILLDRLADLLRAGMLQPETTSVHGVNDVPQILDDMLARRNIGKPVIRIAGDPAFQ